MRRSAAAALAGCLFLSGGGFAAAQNPDPSSARVEQMLLDVPTAQGALDDSARLDQEAHYAGTVGDHDMALWMRDALRDDGFQTSIEPFVTDVPYLRSAALQLLVNPRVDFDLAESRIAADPQGSRPDAGIPFNAWSGSGDVTAPMVYANEGLSADYAALRAARVPVRGRIVLVRYGAEFRGELAARAQAHGAAGVVLYSDPANRDGSEHGAAYPNGPYRPLGAVQRGAVSMGTGALRIPVLPVSALTARRLLQEIHGRPAPAGWRGGLGAAYAVGTSDVPVRLRVEESVSRVTLWNTLGTLAGRDDSHEVIMGGHRDAWVYGVTDNGSGISVLLEAARALGYAYRSGWRPRYSIEIAGWDGEEIGEVGSRAYVRSHFDQLAHGCIAYVNADEVATGNFFHASGVAALTGLTPALARMVPDPRARTLTMWERWRLQNGGIRMRPPGGGSDHEPFLYLVGTPTLEFGFAGPFGVYHSAYDDLRYATTQADPGFANHRTLAQMLALAAFRLTAGPSPYRFFAYAAPMRSALARMTPLAHREGVRLASVRSAIAAIGRLRPPMREAANPAWIDAVHRIDILFYGRNGYASLAFPVLAKALATGDAGTAQYAADATAGSLQAIVRSLR